MRRLVALARGIPSAGRRLLAGVALITFITFVDSGYGAITAIGRVDDAVRQASVSRQFVDVVVELGYKPQVFHLRQLQMRGTVGASTDTSVVLRRVNRSNLDLLSRTPWISRIHLLQ
jgi:GTPase